MKLIIFCTVLLPKLEKKEKVEIDYEDDIYDITKITEKKLAAAKIEKDRIDLIKLEKQKNREEARNQRHIDEKNRMDSNRKEYLEIKKSTENPNSNSNKSENSNNNENENNLTEEELYLLEVEKQVAWELEEAQHEQFKLDQEKRKMKFGEDKGKNFL